MEYMRKHHVQLAVVFLMVCRFCHPISDRSLEESFSDQQFSLHLGMEDDDQITMCDFESACLWTPSNHSQHGDWKVTSPSQLKSQQAGTLPASDHSARSSKGHFLLLSVSPAAEDSGTCEYHLTSPVLPGSNEYCIFQVALFEAGPSVGNLTLMIQPVLSTSAPRSVVLNRRNHDDRRASWEVLEAVIGQVDEPFKVTLVYASCHQATAALDSLDLINCEPVHQDIAPGSKCGDYFYCESSGECIDPNQVCDFHTDCPFGEDEGFICNALPFGSHCSFEQGACGWSVSKRHSGWRRVTGDELFDREDANGDALQQTPGHFLLLQLRKTNSHPHATTQSPLFPPPHSSAAVCKMRFSVYLCGYFNGSLQVAAVEEGTDTVLMVWERNSAGTDNWEEVSLQFTGLQHGFSVKVTVSGAQGSNADIAIDDFAIGAACFETDLHSLLPMADLEDFLSPLPEPSASEVSLMTWWFNTCGASGPFGPTQAQCDSTYRNKNVSVTVGKEGTLKGVQIWKVPATNRYQITAYGAAGGKGAKNHNKRNHGVFISGVFTLEKGDLLYILVGQQGEDACPGRNRLTKKICKEELSVIEDNVRGESGVEWAGGGGAGGGATYVFKMEEGELIPLLIAAGGGGNAYMEDPESNPDLVQLEQYENSTEAPSTSGQTGTAGGGGGWRDVPNPQQSAGKSLVEGAEGGSPCPQAMSRLSWQTYGGFGGGGGACTAGGGGGGYRGGDAAPTDEITTDGQTGVSFVHPMGEIFLQPLAVMESHGECEIKVQLNCSHCETQSCRRDVDTLLFVCICHNEEVLSSDNVTCVSPMSPQGPAPQGEVSTSLILAVVVSTTASGLALICAGVILSKRLVQFCAQSVPSTFHRL